MGIYALVYHASDALCMKNVLETPGLRTRIFNPILQ